MCISLLSLHGYEVKFPYVTSYGETHNEDFFLFPRIQLRKNALQLQKILFLF